MTSSGSDGAFFSRAALSSVPWLLVGKVVTFFIYFAISVLIVRGLGPTQYGIYSLLSSMAEYLMVVCAMGLNMSLLRFVPELTAQSNKAGLRRLLVNSTFMQLVALVAMAVVLYLCSPLLSELFHIALASYAAVLVAFTAMLLAKEFLNNLFTSLFMARFLAITSVGQALIFIVWLLWLGYDDSYSVVAVLTAYSLSIGAMAVISILRLQRFFYAWPASKAKRGIGRRRVLGLTLPMMFNAVTNKLLQQYSEIFFLGYFAVPALVGFYSLGFTLANLLLSFVPLALHTLFTTAFAEAYTRHKESLGNLTSGAYQLLIIVTVPLSCFGFFFAPALIVTVYGANMAPAGTIASFFCLFQILPMIWIPLSMAITATEKVADTMWLNAVQLVVNLVLDYFFIKHFAINGAMAAILITFIVTAPLKLWVISKLIGGIFFPFSFFFRLLTPSIALSAILYFFAPEPSLIVLIGLGFAYPLLFCVALRLFGLIRHDDVVRFRAIDIPALNRTLDFLTG